MDRLAGKVAVITGGASGIGLATTQLFLREQARVVIWDRGQAPTSDAFEPAPREGQLRCESVDVTDRESVRAAAAEIHQREARIDILINCAGISFGVSDALQLSEDAWDKVLGTNLKGALNATQAVAPFMRQQGSGCIVNVSSVLARYGYPGHTAYVASKSALEGLTRVWARELGPSGIRVNAVSPGYVDTPMNAGNPAALVQQVVAMTPLRRLGQPEDVGRAFLYLCSEDSAFVTGAVLPVDGGLIT